MKIFTIGFTKKSASRFFELVRSSGAKRVVDVRLRNVSQLAGFAKGGKDNLGFLLDEVCGVDYVHLPKLAPTKELLDDYRKGRCDWDDYERRFPELMRSRAIEKTVPRGGHRGWLLAVQRGQAAPLPPSARCRVPE